MASALASTWAWSNASRLTLGIRVSASRSARSPGTRAATRSRRAEIWSGESTSVTRPTLPTPAPVGPGARARHPPASTYSGDVFGRSKTTNEQLDDELHPQRDGAKNRPTPKRKDQEAARRQPLVVADRKQAKRLDKVKRNEQMAKTRQAMLTGDESGLPPRDKGPVRRYMRDYIDARWNLAEFMLPVMLVVLALSFMRTSTILFFVTILTYGVLLTAIVDTFLMWRRLRKKLGDEVRRRGGRRQGQRHVRRDARLPAAPLADAAHARQARRVPRLSRRLSPGPSRLIGP